MKILLPLLTFLFLTIGSNAFCQMPTHTLSTGYAYSTCNGNIVGKYSEGAGDAVVLSSGCIITDVTNQSALNAITIYTPPASAQSQLDTLRKQALNTLADSQLANSPTALAQSAALKQQGAQ